ncbi:transposable element Tcb2 transposase [Trichonephila clavipes]|nr:transposable element Tcb2 transposase [Trichonephila clavipes]
MPDKRARRHFSQLSEFERGLIIGRKTAGCSTRRVAGQVDHSECAVRNCWQQWTREGTHARKTGSRATRKTTRREDGRIVRQALVDPTVTYSTMTSPKWSPKGTLFQQDNPRPHTAKVAQDFLRHFQTLPWPARSPDLSHVEHVWDQLKRQMPSCQSVHDLELAVQELWPICLRTT